MSALHLNDRESLVDGEGALVALDVGGQGGVNFGAFTWGRIHLG